ncbi:MAG: pilus assembly protein [Methylomicrobium sp.]
MYHYRIRYMTTLTTQTGVVLPISLILLLLLTLVGVTGTQTTVLQERMAGNMRDKNLAFQAAESALKFAETRLNPLPTFTAAGTGGFYSADSNLLSPEAILTDAFWSTNPTAVYNSDTLSSIDPNNPPRYVIQDMGCADPLNCPGPNSYRITARATGGTTHAVVILQSVVVMP